MRLTALRRTILLLVLALLPLQSGWAAVSAYCEHEAVASGHVGHHFHEHDQDRHDNQVPGDTSHPDCGVCHLGAAVFANPAVNGLMLSSAEGIDGDGVRPLAPPVFELQKPNWLRLA